MKDRAQLRVLTMGSPAEPRTLVDNPDFVYVFPAGWSPDGLAILVMLQRRDFTWQLGWVSATTGAVTVLRSLDWQFNEFRNGPELSPDGRFIVYATFTGPRRSPGPNEAPTSPNGGPGRSIHILAADGSRDGIVAAAVSGFTSPVWTSGGSRILFLSERDGSGRRISLGQRGSEWTAGGSAHARQSVARHERRPGRHDPRRPVVLRPARVRLPAHCRVRSRPEWNDGLLRGHDRLRRLRRDVVTGWSAPGVAEERRAIARWSRAGHRTRGDVRAAGQTRCRGPSRQQDGSAVLLGFAECETRSGICGVRRYDLGPARLVCSVYTHHPRPDVERPRSRPRAGGEAIYVTATTETGQN